MSVLSVREARRGVGAAWKRRRMAVRCGADAVSGKDRESRDASNWTAVAGAREKSVIGAIADALKRPKGLEKRVFVSRWKRARVRDGTRARQGLEIFGR